MESIAEIVRQSILEFEIMRKTPAYYNDNKYAIAIFDCLYNSMYAQIHKYLVFLPNGNGEQKIREYIDLVDNDILPTLRSKLKAINKMAAKLKNISKSKEELKSISDFYNSYGKIYEDFLALSAFRNIENFALYMEWGIPENDKVWKYNTNCFRGFWYYANKMVLDGTVKYLEKQCPTGYGKSYADTVMIAYIFGVDYNSDVLKVVGNPSLITDMTNKLVKYMCKANYSKVFPYYEQFECDSAKMFDVCREGGNNQPSRLLIHGSRKGTSFLMINKDTPIDGGRFKYRFYDDITRSKDKANVRMHERDISQYESQWKKRKYDDNDNYEIISGTTYHIYDFLSYIKRKYGGEEAKQSKVNKYTKFNAKYRSVFVSVPKLDWETDESTYPQKYSTEEAREDRKADYNLFMAMDMQEPMPIEGCAFSYENLQTYSVIPHKEDEKESCWAMLDPARTGANYVAMTICIPIDEKHYLKDCIFQMKPMEKVYSVIVNKIIQHHITRLHIERNTDTSLKTLLDEMLHKVGIYYCEITEIYTYKKKENKIYDNEASIKSSIVFPEFGLYVQGSEMGKFMKYLTSFSYVEKNLFDDSIDSVAMYAEKFISFKKTKNTLTIFSRKKY